MKKSPALGDLTKQRGFRVGVLVASPLLCGVLAYSGEIARLFSFLTAPPSSESTALDATVFHALAVMGYEVFLFCAVFYGTLALVAQFTLPVQTGVERRRVVGRLLLYALGQHGPATFIKNGRQIASAEEGQTQAELYSQFRYRYYRKPGLILVDTASAVALESDLVPPEIQVRRGELSTSLLDMEESFHQRRWQAAAQGVRWLRKQIVGGGRNFHLFLLQWGLSAPRRIYRVARVAGPGIVFVEGDEHLREALDLRPQIRTRPGISALTSEGIKLEATITVRFRLAEVYQPNRASGGLSWTSGPSERNRSPYPLNPESAFHAVYGSPLSPSGEVKHWTDLPAFVASDIFRDMIANHKLDDLFRPTTEGYFPLEELRKEFNKRVRESPVLEERGIYIITAKFGTLALPPLVKEQRIQSWRADWDRRTIETLAGGDLQATRIVQRARVEGEAELARQMATFFNQSTTSRATVVLRLFQAIEAAASNPSTRRLLPAETVQVLTPWFRNLRRWLGPEEFPLMGESDETP